MKIIIDTDYLKELGIDIFEYVALYLIYEGRQDIDSKFLKSLEDKGFVKSDDKIYLRDKARLIFEQEKDYFCTWLASFPIKTPSNRYLSPVNPDTIMGQKLRKKWNSLFKNNAVAAQKAIEVLEAEMEWRRKTGKFEFMHNAETWLNQGDFEKYEYLLKDKKDIQSKIRQDYE